MPLSSDPAARERQLANRRTFPAAPVGNDRGATHSAAATAKTLPVAGKARELREMLAAETPLRDADGGLPAADSTAVELLALCLLRIERVAAWLEEHGEFDKRGRPRPVLEVERRLRAEARDHMRDLGLTPRARVAIGLSLQRGREVSLAELLADLDEDGADG
jgi:hypothetical protein